MVSGTLASKQSFAALRTEILDDFSNEAYLGIQWDVSIDDEVIAGTDRELFPEDYDADQRRQSM